MAGVRFAILGAAAAALVSIGLTAAAQDATESIKARQTLMKGIGDNSKGIGNVVKGTSSESLDDLKRRAGEISAAAAKIPAAFGPEFHAGNAPAGVETTALPVIWTDKAKFEESAKAMEAASAKLSEAADMEAATAGFAAMAKTCGGCHNTFRQKKS